MYCYNCKSIINNGLSQCPFCKADMRILEDVVLSNELNEIGKAFPDSYFLNSKDFNVRSYSITITGGSYYDAIINHLVNKLFNSSFTDFINWVHGNSFKSISKYGEAKLISIFGVQSYIVAAFLKRMGVNVDTTTINEELGYFTTFTSITTSLNLAKSQSSHLENEYKKLRRENNQVRQIRWAGGGFGVAGAIKGAVEAQVLNVGTSLVQGAFNILKNSAMDIVSSQAVNYAENEVKDSQEFKNYIYEEWIDHYKSLHRYIRDKLKQKLGKSEDFNYLLPTIHHVNLSRTNADTGQNLIEKLKKNPMDLTIYTRLYSLDPSYGKDLLKVADFCGIQSEVKDVFAKEFAAKDCRVFTIKDIGFGTPKEELITIKKQLDFVAENNPAAIEEVNIAQYRENVETTLMTYEISEAVSFVNRLFRHEGITASVEKVQETESELIKDVFFATYCRKHREMRKQGAMQAEAWIEELTKKLPDPFVIELLLISSISELNIKDTEVNAMRVIKQMAFEGFVESMAYIGICMVHGWHGEDDYELGIELLKKALEHNNHLALAHIGTFYQEGSHGFPQNSKLAKKYLTYADLMGVEYATNVLKKCRR